MAEDHNEQSPPESGAQAAPQKKGSSRGKVILGGVIAVLVVCAALYWFLTRNEVETDDAFTAGRAVSIAPHVEGYVVELLVNDNQFVRKGQVLARIDPRDWQASRDQAAATLAGAEAHVSAAQMMHEVALLQYPGKLIQAQGQLNQAKARELRAQADYRRQRSVERAATSQQDIDYARAAGEVPQGDGLTAQGAVESAMPVKPKINNAGRLSSENEAQVKSGRAQLVEADRNLEWTVIRAPTDGWISQRNVEQGNYARKGQSLFAIVEPVVWIVANYKETQITNIRPGQKVDVRVDAYPSLRLHGHVDSIQKGTGATFSAFPPENATGNYVKIVQRVPVKILIDDGLNPDQPLALGLSVEPTVHVDTAGRSDAPPPASVQAAP